MGKSVFGKNSVSLQSRSTWTLTGAGFGALAAGCGALAFTAFFGAGAVLSFGTVLRFAPFGFAQPCAFETLLFATFGFAGLGLASCDGHLGLGHLGLGGFACGGRFLPGCGLCRGFFGFAALAFFNAAFLGAAFLAAGFRLAAAFFGFAALAFAAFLAAFFGAGAVLAFAGFLRFGASAFTFALRAALAAALPRFVFFTMIRVSAPRASTRSREAF